MIAFRLLILLLSLLAAGILWQQEQLAALALVRIDPVPETRTLVAEEHYADAADYLGFFMDYDYVQQDPAAQTLYSQIEAVRADPAYQADKFAEGLIQGTSDEVIGQAVGVASDFFVIGDLRDHHRCPVPETPGQGYGYLRRPDGDALPSRRGCLPRHRPAGGQTGRGHHQARRHLWPGGPAAAGSHRHAHPTHDRNDAILERIYIGRRFKNDTERLEKLFEMYTRMTAAKTDQRSRRRASAQAQSHQPEYRRVGMSQETLIDTQVNYAIEYQGQRGEQCLLIKL